VRLPDHRHDVRFGKQVENIVGDEAIPRGRRLERGRRSVGEGDLGPCAEGCQPLPRESHHGGTQVERPVARVRREMFGEETEREAARATAELEHAMRGLEVAVLDQQRRRAILVERLRILAGADAIVDAPRLVAREHRSQRAFLLRPPDDDAQGR